MRFLLALTAALGLAAGSAGADLGSFPLGSTPTPTGTVFRVWAPHAGEVNVAGSFNGWDTLADSMTNDGGIWSVFVSGAAAGAEYKYVLRRSGFGTMWRKDPRAKRVVHSAGNSIVASPDFNWTDQGWSPPDPGRLVIYELHIGTAAGYGDGLWISGPAQFDHLRLYHLDELVDLGVNALELLPVGEFPTDWSWGYNPSDIYAPESAYGGLEAFKRLVDACHARGIAVILDVVYNHLGPTDLDLWNFDGDQIYFYPDDRAHTPWGDTRPDYRTYQVRRYLIDNVLFYAAECHVDGFRFDGFGYIVEPATDPEGYEFIRDLQNELAATMPGVFTIAEHAGLQPWVTSPTSSGGAGFRAQWYPEFSDALRAACAAAIWGDPDVGSVAAGISAAAGQPSGSVVYYAESHDTAGETNTGPNKGKRLSVVADPGNPQSSGARAVGRMAGGVVLTAPGMPMLFMGEEWNEDVPFESAWNRRINWGLRTANAGDVAFFRKAVSLRTSRNGLQAGSPAQVHHVNDGAGNVFAFTRGWSWATSLVMICNVGGQDFSGGYRVGVPYGGGWRVLLNSAEPAYGGDGPSIEGTSIPSDAISYDGMAQSVSVPLGRHAFVVLEPAGTPPSAPVPEAPADGATGLDPRVTLRVSGYSDPEADPHAATQWQIATDAGFAETVFDSGADAEHLTTIRMASGVLGRGIEYFWRARFQDGRAAWGPWSEVRRFTTEPARGSMLGTY